MGDCQLLWRLHDEQYHYLTSAGAVRLDISVVASSILQEIWLAPHGL